MAIDLGDTPVGTPPTPEQQEQIRASIGIASTDSMTFSALSLAGQSVGGEAATNLVNLTTTWNTTGNPSMIYGRVTNTNSGATSNLLDLGTVAAGSLFKIDKTGEVNVTGTIISTNDFKVGAARHFHHINRAAIGSPATGIHTLSNAALNDYDRLQFGGTTSLFPAIKRNAAGLQIKLADDSAFTSLGALSLSLSGQSLTVAAATNLLDLSATWNTNGNPSLIYARVTNTNSGASSNLINLGTVASGELFKVTKAGNVSFGSAVGFHQSLEPAGNTAFNIKCYGTVVGGFASTDYPQGLHLNSSSSLMWTNGSGGVAGSVNVDLRLSRDGTGILAQRNLGLTQIFRLYNATSATPLVDWDRASFSFTSGNLRIAAENSGTLGYATARGIDFAVSGAVRLSILANGSTNFINEAYFLSPLYSFDGTNSYLGLRSSGGINKLFTTSGSTNKNITISPADVAMMTLTQNGVGIGTTNPVADLDIAETWNAPAISVTGASGDGTTATITFATQATAIPVGSTVVVAGISPAGYNGTFVVTASNLISVSYLNATTTVGSGGTVQRLFTSIKLNVTDTASNAGSNLLDLQVGGVSKFKVDKSGTATLPVVVAGFITLSSSTINLGNSAGSVALSGTQMQIGSSTTTSISLFNGTSTTPLLAFGGITSSFPSIKRNSTRLQAVLANDSGFTNIQGKLTTDTAFTLGAAAATGYITIYDSNNVAYRVWCTPA